MALLATGRRDTRDPRGSQGVFAITNFTNDVALDCDSTSDGELADVLSTVIKQLIEQGILNGTVNSA